MVVSIKNNSGSSQTFAGVTIADTATADIDPADLVAVCKDLNLHSLLLKVQVDIFLGGDSLYIDDGVDLVTKIASGVLATS